MNSHQTLWKIEPHSLAKHEILDRYLGAWFAILGSSHRRIVYLDGFCGPGRYEGGEPGSPIIALNKAIGHQGTLSNTEFVFIFIDEREDRIRYLSQEIESLSVPTNFRINIRTQDFGTIISEMIIYQEVKNSPAVPTFAFVDPFGWKGIRFDIIRKLLHNRHTEVLISFMADSINRFINHPDKQGFPVLTRGGRIEASQEQLTEEEAEDVEGSTLTRSLGGDT